MNSKERILAAIEHKETSKTPVDLGGYQSGICWRAYNSLKNKIGLKTETKILEPIQMLAAIEEPILNQFNVDTRYIFPDFFPERCWEDDYTFVDAWGIKWQRQPNGNYHNMIIHPFKDFDNINDFQKYKWPKSDKLYNKDEIENIINSEKSKGYAIFTSLSGVFEQAWYLRGFENFFLDLAANKKFAEKILDNVLEVLLHNYSIYFDNFGDNIDCVQFWGDVGSQNGPLIDPKMYKEIIRPREEKLIQFTKENTNAKIGWHSCGSCQRFIPDFIDMGIDILNPIQINAKNMDPIELKRKYGNDIAFWGGIDSQELLPKKTPQEVRKEVRRIIEIFSLNGGYIFSGCHNIQNDVPPENIIAMFDEAKKI